MQGDTTEDKSMDVLDDLDLVRFEDSEDLPGSRIGFAFEEVDGEGEAV